jgi:hypothetical protein
MLDGLEGGDGPTELHAHLGVGGGLLGALVGDTGRLGRDNETGEVDERTPSAGDHGGRCTVERDPSRAPRRVEVRWHLHLHAPGRHLDDDGVVARGQHEDVGEAAAQDRRRRPGGLTVAHRDVGLERHAGADGPVGQPGQQSGRHLVGAGRVNDGAGDHGRDEGPGRQRSPQLFDDDDQLGQAETRAAVLLGQVEAEPAQLRDVAPERGQGLGLCFEQDPGRPSGIVLGQEVRGGLAKGAVVFGDGDRHA